MRVLVFGDSIVQGFNDPEGGWVNRLWKHYAQSGFEPTVFNLGVSGDTAKDVLSRFQQETNNRKYPGEEFAFVFFVGGNDAVVRGEEAVVTPETFGEQISELIGQAREFSGKILFLGPLPVVDEMCNPIPWSKSGKSVNSDRLKRFDESMENVCGEKDVPYLQMFNLFDDYDLKEMLDDGVHPNVKGHQLMADIVQPKLEEILK